MVIEKFVGEASLDWKVTAALSMGIGYPKNLALTATTFAHA